MMKPHVRRAVSLLLLALALGVTCTFLGRWQWNRHVARDAQIRLIEDNYSAQPVPLSTLVATPDEALPADAEWRQVTVTGRYETDATVLLRNRPIGGMAGYHVLVPLVVADGGEAGAVLVVDRGWVPTGENGTEVAGVPAPPAGTVTVTVRLRRDEAASPRSAPPRQVQAISVDQVLAAGDAIPTTTGSHSAYRVYGEMAAEDPAPDHALGALPSPSTDPGSHLSYAFQWWTFAVGSLVGFTAMARRELQDGSAAGPKVRPERRRRSPSAEDEEDALVDSQLG
ncbi:MAG TPA: SURF1 family protein [Cellulomonas sp.]|uniref:SURF1 family cytochrome oxidase biogenesis protein n=1 Tax=Cellulomonas sp. TaxID=40001 RepID=UPI002E377B3B|nr:SURF1 family protein [Cellulomonas sp.]HEX5332696.1 SURF1 family protein [Cellulomonas sp.]